MKWFRNTLHILHFVYAVFWFIVLIVCSFFITLILLLFPEPIRDKGMFGLMKLISHTWFVLCGFIQRNYHHDKIDFSQSYIITPNHQSYLDAAIIYTTIPGVFKTLGKVEIEKAPIYGLIYKTVVITVDRSSVTAKANSFRRMKKELEKGLSIVIFSEGTFPPEPQSTLMPFQQGGYSLAHMQKTSILPVLFLDAADRMHPSKLWKTKPGMNRSVFLPPLAADLIQKAEAASIKRYAETYMQSCLDFCRTHSVDEVWNYALLWQKNNPIEVR
jgi:1-acyl-sn-glycerol-3-phosphate acyltransferase